MSRERPTVISDNPRVVRLTPRNRRRARSPPGCRGSDLEDYDSVVPSLVVYESCESDDDFRHRMTINCIGFAVNLLLIIIGVWLADQIAGSESRLTTEPAMSLARANGNAGPLLQPNQPLKDR